MNDYDDDEYYVPEYDVDDDPEPSCWSQDVYLIKQGHRLFLSEITLVGYSNGRFGSFGYPDITAQDEEFPIHQVVKRLQKKLRAVGRSLENNQSVDVNWVKYYRRAHAIKRPAKHRMIYRYNW